MVWELSPEHDDQRLRGLRASVPSDSTFRNLLSKSFARSSSTGTPGHTILGYASGSRRNPYYPQARKIIRAGVAASAGTTPHAGFAGNHYREFARHLRQKRFAPRHSRAPMALYLILENLYRDESPYRFRPPDVHCPMGNRGDDPRPQPRLHFARLDLLRLGRMMKGAALANSQHIERQSSDTTFSTFSTKTEHRQHR